MFAERIHLTDNQYEVTTATTLEEAKQILSTGFDYIRKKRNHAVKKTKEVLQC